MMGVAVGCGAAPVTDCGSEMAGIEELLRNVLIVLLTNRKDYEPF